MASSHQHALLGQRAAQHPGTHERVLQVQLVNTPHQRQVGRVDQLGNVVDRAAADVQQLGLLGYGEVVMSVDHHLALSRPALVSASFAK